MSEEKKDIKNTVLVAETPDDLVVAVVPFRFHLPLADGSHKEFVPGEITMTREHAEHWFSKSRGVRIVGVPDTKSIKSADAMHNVGTLKEIFGTALIKVAALHTLNDLTKPQSLALEEFNKAILAANDAFVKFVAAVEV